MPSFLASLLKYNTPYIYLQGKNNTNHLTEASSNTRLSCAFVFLRGVTGVGYAMVISQSFSTLIIYRQINRQCLLL